MREFPNKNFREMELYYFFNKDTFVYKQSEPYERIKHYLLRNCDLNSYLYNNWHKDFNKFPNFIDCNHEYDQIGDPTNMFNKVIYTYMDISILITLWL